MSSTKKKLTINAASAIIQVSFTAVLYFFLYKYLLNHLGAKQLGVWSLILSFSSIANLANFGITSGLVKFIADYLAEKKEEKLGKLICTGFLTIAALFSFVSLIVWVAAHYFLHFIIDAQHLELALSILPYSLAGLCINAASGVLTSVLEGHQKNYLRNFIYIFSGILMFVSMVLLTPIYQLQGMAYAQLIQAIFIMVFAFILIWKINPYNRFKYWKWSKQSFKELFNYGYKFQIVSICQLLYEPTTKMLLSKFGGLAFLGHYEMASRLVGQFRSLLVSANQVVVPVIAEKTKTQTKEHLLEFYGKMNRLLLVFALPLSTTLIVLTPFISIIWIGDLNTDFIFAMYVLTIATMFNIMCGPSYYSCLGEGRLSILVVVHIGMAIANFVLGYLLGWALNGYGIILAWGLSLALGSLALILAYAKKMSIQIKSLFTKNDLQLIGATSLILIIAISFFSLSSLNLGRFYKTLIILPLILVYIPLLLKNQELILILNSLKMKFKK